MQEVAEDTFALLINEQMADGKPAAATRAVVQLIMNANAYSKLRQHADLAAAQAVPW